LSDLIWLTVFFRNWQDRRVACTEDVIAFARVGDSLLLDAVPLSEVTSVGLMMSNEHRSQQHGPTTSYDSVVDFTHAFQIQTVKNGHNAGRKYILRADTDEEVSNLIEHLGNIAKKAARARKKTGETCQERLQRYVRKVYSASWFQAITATLIIAVK
jgi:hypothetical protein